MGGQETKAGEGPEQPPQEKFGLVEVDRLAEAIRKSTFLLDPQKSRLEQLIRAIPEDLDPIPANVMPLLIIQRAEERDTAVSQSEHLRGENTELRGENESLKQQVSELTRQLSKGKEETQESKEADNIDGDVDTVEREIFERMLTVYEEFVENIEPALEDIACKNEGFDGLALLHVVFRRLFGIDTDQLSPLEQIEIDLIAKDLGYDPDHEVDTVPIEKLLANLKQELEKAREIDQGDSAQSEDVQSEEEHAAE